MKKYKCISCGYVYDPQNGDAENGIEKGIAFEKLPSIWVCPVCFAGVNEFEEVMENISFISSSS